MELTQTGFKWFQQTEASRRANPMEFLKRPEADRVAQERPLNALLPLPFLLFDDPDEFLEGLHSPAVLSWMVIVVCSELQIKVKS